MAEAVSVGWTWEDHVKDIRTPLWVARLACKSSLHTACMDSFPSNFHISIRSYKVMGFVKKISLKNTMLA